MKTLIFTLITLSFVFSHAGRIDRYYRDVARTGALKPKPKPRALKTDPRRDFSRTVESGKAYSQFRFFEAVKEAAEKGSGRDLKVVEEFLKKGPADVLLKAGTAVEGKVLHIAAQSENVKLVNLLLKYGADPSVRDVFGRTPLHLVTTPEVAKILIKAGADVNARENSLGYTPLHLVETPEVARTLIENGADVNAKGLFGKAPLHVVTTPEVARTLIENGADVNMKDKRGKTPLDMTRIPEVARILKEASKKKVE